MNSNHDYVDNTIDKQELEKLNEKHHKNYKSQSNFNSKRPNILNSPTLAHKSNSLRKPLNVLGPQSASNMQAFSHSELNEISEASNNDRLNSKRE